MIFYVVECFLFNGPELSQHVRFEVFPPPFQPVFDVVWSEGAVHGLHGKFPHVLMAETKR